MLDYQCPKCKHITHSTNEKIVHCARCSHLISVTQDVQEVAKFKKFLAERKLKRKC